MLSISGTTVDGIANPRSFARLSRHINKLGFDNDRFKEEYIETFVKFLSTASYDVFLPITAEAVSLTATYRTGIEKYCAVPLPEKEAINLCFDKVRTAALAEKVGVKHPRTWDFASREDLQKHAKEIVFPVVVKGRHEMSAFSARYAENVAALMRHISDWENKYAGKVGEGFPCIQQRIRGAACGFFALYDHGVCRQYFMHRRVREVPATGGPSSCAESIHENDLLEAGVSLLDALDWHGVAMVEFKREQSTNELYLIEINPKFWGSLELSYASGINFPYGAVLLAAGRPLPGNAPYTVGKRFQWLLPDDL